jgi:hypothetical protein
MANRSFAPLLGSLDRGVVIIAGSFAPDTANAPTDVKGDGFSVVRTSTGLFTVTLQDKYSELIGVTASLQLASADDKMVQIGATDVTSAKTIQIRVWDISGAAVADVAANANNRINFVLVLKNTSV